MYNIGYVRKDGVKENIEYYVYTDINETIINEIVDNIKQSGYKRTKKTKQEKTSRYYYNDFATYDTETSNIPTSRGMQGYCYMHQFYVGGYQFLLRKNEHFKELLFKIESKLDHILVVYVHNLAFEFQYLKSFIEITNENVFAIDSRKPVKVNISNIEFRCSYILSGKSLDKYTQSNKRYRKEKEIMDYSKIRTSTTKLEDNTILYSVLDTLALHEAIKDDMEQNGYTMASQILTNTQRATKDIYERCVSNNEDRTTKKEIADRKRICSKLDSDAYRVLRNTFRGGNTHANVEYVGHVLDQIGHVDIGSSYPFQMITEDEFPVSTLTKVDLNSEGVLNESFYRHLVSLHKFIVCMFEVKNIRLKEGVTNPYLSLHKTGGASKRRTRLDNGRIVSSDRLLFYATDKEFLEIICKQYEWDSISTDDSYIADKGFLPLAFRQVVYSYYEKKTTLKNADEDESLSKDERENILYEYNRSKAFLNSLYGIMVMEILRDDVSFIDNMFVRNRLTDNMLLDGGYDEKIRKYYDNEKHFLVYQWGIVVTMLARCYLQEMIDLCGSDFVYCDTDSVFYKNPDKWEHKYYELSMAKINRYLDKVINTKYYVPVSACNRKGKEKFLGILAPEKTADKFITWGAKKYCQYIAKDENNELEEYKRIAQEDTGKANAFKKTMTHGIEITVSGVPKKLGSVELYNKGGIEAFDIGFVWNECGKKTARYNEEHFTEMIVNSDGKNEILEFNSNVAIVDTDYKLGLSEDFSHYITDVQSLLDMIEQDVSYDDDMFV